MSQESIIETFRREHEDGWETWAVELDGDSYRTIESTSVDEEEYVSDWKVCDTKYAGQKNERTPEVQAMFEVESLIAKMEKKGYSAIGKEPIETSPPVEEPKEPKGLTFLDVPIEGDALYFSQPVAGDIVHLSINTYQSAQISEDSKDLIERVFEKNQDVVFEAAITEEGRVILHDIIEGEGSDLTFPERLNRMIEITPRQSRVVASSVPIKTRRDAKLLYERYTQVRGYLGQLIKPAKGATPQIHDDTER